MGNYDVPPLINYISEEERVTIYPWVAFDEVQTK
jgi:hypothetical protein